MDFCTLERVKKKKLITLNFSSAPFPETSILTKYPRGWGQSSSCAYFLTLERVAGEDGPHLAEAQGPSRHGRHVGGPSQGRVPRLGFSRRPPSPAAAATASFSWGELASWLWSHNVDIKLSFTLQFPYLRLQNVYIEWAFILQVPLVLWYLIIISYLLERVSLIFICSTKTAAADELYYCNNKASVSTALMVFNVGTDHRQSWN